MPMNKNEKALMEEARRQAAFYRTLPVTPDVAAAELEHAGASEILSGFLPTGKLGHSPQVQPAITTPVSHGVGEHVDARSDLIKGPRDLYSSRLLALQALRWQLEQECMTALREVDREIARELAVLATPTDTTGA